MKRIVAIILLLVFSLVACSNTSSTSEIKKLQEENKMLKKQIDMLDSNSSIFDSSDENTDNVSSDTKEDKFKEIEITVYEKRIAELDYGQQFIELKTKVINNYGKDIKGIEGTLVINDMFDKEILSLNWDFLESIIKTGKETNIEGFGIDYNQFMREHQKAMTTPFESMKFKYIFKTVIFTDGTSIKA